MLIDAFKLGRNEGNRREKSRGQERAGQRGGKEVERMEKRIGHHNFVNQSYAFDHGCIAI